MIQFEQWEGFEGRIWKEEVNVRDFIQKNYTPYDGNESFLAGPTEATDKLWGALQQLQKAERAKGGVLDMETEVVSSLTSYGPGYIDENLKDLEQIVGLQTDKPLKRAFMPYGGIKMAEQACTTYGYQPSAELHKIFTDYTRTHNQAVFDAYTPEMKKARHTHIITGLPDTYGRGRIVGDYRRVALYGIDALIKFKQEDFANCGDGTMTDDVIRLREEIARQISALKGMKKMAEAYGYDISQPAKNAKEACQWLYFGYLAAIKTQNGAAMSVGRISTFLDIYIQRDLDKGILTESQAQELIDHMVMKFRMVKFARIPSYNQLFSGDPVWATLEVGGIVLPTQNNYAGIGALNGNAKGQAATFPDPRTGVRAQIQHLKAYASKEALVNGCVDPRFSLVTRGSAQYVEWLGASDNPNGKGWAVPGKGYGSKIIALLGQIMAFEVPQPSAPSEPEEQEPEFPAYQLEGLETLVEAGVINSPEFWRQKFSEQVTVGEMFGILGKLFTKVTE